MSGVLATLSAGLTPGNLDSLGRISDRGKEAVQDFWEYAAFVANSLILLLIGMRVATQDFRAVWLPATIAVLLVTLGRAARYQHLLFWGRPARSAGSRIGFSSAGGCSRARCHCHHQLRGGGLLDLRSGFDDETATARCWTTSPRRLTLVRTRTPSTRSSSLDGARAAAASRDACKPWGPRAWLRTRWYLRQSACSAP